MSLRNYVIVKALISSSNKEKPFSRLYTSIFGRLIHTTDRMTPTTSKNWVVTGADKKDFDGLELQDAQIPELSENEILVT